MKALIFTVLVLTVSVIGLSPAAAAGPAHNRAPGQVAGHPCGGDLPPCYVLYRESKGTNAQNRHSSASGYWEFVRGTWNHYQGYSTARSAPGAVQDDKARLVWDNGRGCRHWRACG